MPYDAMPRTGLGPAPSVDPDVLLPVKMACVVALVNRNLPADEVLEFCRRADRQKPETFKRVVGDYFTLAR